MRTHNLTLGQKKNIILNKIIKSTHSLVLGTDENAQFDAGAPLVELHLPIADGGLGH